MSIAEQRPRPRDLDPGDPQQAIDDAHRAGITDFQVIALIRPSTAREFVLLLAGHDASWSLPVAWVHPTQTVPLTLDWLCDRHVGLADWRAAFATTAVHRTSGDTDVLQIAFDVTVPPDGSLSWPGRCRWWHVDTDPPNLHRLSRPLVQRLQSPGHRGTPRA